MLKNRSKDELLEMLYRLEAERNGLIDCYEKQSEVLRQVAETTKSKRNWISLIINFFVLPFKIAAILRNNHEYFFTLKTERMKFTEEQILEAYEAINEFENNQLAPKVYKEYVAKMLELKDAICDTCGDVMSRLHNDFQKRINAETQKLREHLLKPIKFESGKYHEGGFYEKRVPILCYSDLRKLCLVMKADIKKYDKRSLKTQAKLIGKDLKTLQTYIVEKLNGVGEYLDEIVLDVSKSNELDSVAAGVKADKEKVGESDGITKTETPEETPEVENAETTNEVEAAKSVSSNETEEKSEDSETEKSEPPLVYNNEDALEFRKQKLTYKEIGKIYGFSESKVRSRLKKYTDELEVNK